MQLGSGSQTQYAIFPVTFVILLSSPLLDGFKSVDFSLSFISLFLDIIFSDCFWYFEII